MNSRLISLVLCLAVISLCQGCATVSQSIKYRKTDTATIDSHPVMIPELIGNRVCVQVTDSTGLNGMEQKVETRVRQLLVSRGFEVVPTRDGADYLLQTSLSSQVKRNTAGELQPGSSYKTSSGGGIAGAAVGGASSGTMGGTLLGAAIGSVGGMVASTIADSYVDVSQLDIHVKLVVKERIAESDMTVSADTSAGQETVASTSIRKRTNWMPYHGNGMVRIVDSNMEWEEVSQEACEKIALLAAKSMGKY